MEQLKEVDKGNLSSKIYETMYHANKTIIVEEKLNASLWDIYQPFNDNEISIACAC